MTARATFDPRSHCNQGLPTSARATMTALLFLLAVSLFHSPCFAVKFTKFYGTLTERTTSTFSLDLGLDEKLTNVSYYEVVVLKLNTDHDGIPRLTKLDSKAWTNIVPYTSTPIANQPYIASKFRADQLPWELSIGDKNVGNISLLQVITQPRKLFETNPLQFSARRRLLQWSPAGRLFLRHFHPGYCGQYLTSNSVHVRLRRVPTEQAPTRVFPHLAQPGPDPHPHRAARSRHLYHPCHFPRPVVEVWSPPETVDHAETEGEEKEEES